MYPFALLALLAAAGPWRTYEVYQPRIERCFVNDAQAQDLSYNHDSSVAWYGDRWFCLWNANTPPIEGKPGQLNYESTSRDGRTWSRPVPAFSSAERCENPVPCPTGTQWQPNLIVVGSELWAVWCQNSKGEHNGCYVSRLSRPDGKWKNQHLLWEGSESPLIDGKRWSVFPSQNPARLRGGRILAPVTMQGPDSTDAPAGIGSWWAREKRDSVLYTDDEGKTWHVSPGAIQPGRSWAQWEPTVWEQPDGSVMMLSRNNDPRAPTAGGPRPSEMLLWSRSTDGGATWTPHIPVPLETVASRMHVLPAGGDRVALVHNDWPAGAFVSDRRNLALFFTRGAGTTFTAGPGISGEEPVVAYPQMWIHGNALAVCYSQGRDYRSIKVAHVSPLPNPERYYLFPRTNLPASTRPAREGAAFRFAGGQHVATRQMVDPGEEAFSAGVWVRAEDGGVLLDTRSTAAKGGFVWGIMGGNEQGLASFVHLGTKEGNLVSSLRIPRGEWAYLGLTVDNTAGQVIFHVDGRHETLVFTAPATRPLRGDTGHIGGKRLENSGLSGISGEIRALALYRAARFGAEEHAGFANRFAASLGRAKRQPARIGSEPAALLFDPADAVGIQRDFLLPSEPNEGVSVVQTGDGPALRFAGQASAGVDVDDNHRVRGDGVRLSFRFRVDEGEESALCTLGDANEPARLVAAGGRVWLRAGEQRVACGNLKAGVWNEVELFTRGTRTAARLNGGPAAEVEHRPAGTWVYLGQGYRTGAAGGRFLVLVGSVRSRVERL